MFGYWLALVLGSAPTDGDGHVGLATAQEDQSKVDSNGYIEGLPVWVRVRVRVRVGVRVRVWVRVRVRVRGFGLG